MSLITFDCFLSMTKSLKKHFLKYFKFSGTRGRKRVSGMPCTMGTFENQPMLIRQMAFFPDTLNIVVIGPSLFRSNILVSLSISKYGFSHDWSCFLVCIKQLFDFEKYPH